MKIKKKVKMVFGNIDNHIFFAGNDFIKGNFDFL